MATTHIARHLIRWHNFFVPFPLIKKLLRFLAVPNVVKLATIAHLATQEVVKSSKNVGIAYRNYNVLRTP